jgi:hypothetical protein
MVIAGHGAVVPIPHRTNWLTLTLSVMAGSAGVSVPAAGDTLTTWSGSLATETDQLTVPPDACSETSEPVSPGTTIIVPPPGSTESVPGVGRGGGGGGAGGGGGGGLEFALVGVGVGVGVGVAAGVVLAVVGACGGTGFVLAGGEGLAVTVAADGPAVAGTAATGA